MAGKRRGALAFECRKRGVAGTLALNECSSLRARSQGAVAASLGGGCGPLAAGGREDWVVFDDAVTTPATEAAVVAKAGADGYILFFAALDA